MRAAAEIDAAVEIRSTGADGYRRFGQHGDGVGFVIHTRDAFGEQHVEHVLRAHDKDAGLLLARRAAVGFSEKFFVDDLAFRGVEDKKPNEVNNAIHEAARDKNHVGVVPRSGKDHFLPFEFLGFDVHDVHLRFGGQRFATRAGCYRGPAQKLPFRQRDQAHGRMVGNDVRVFEQGLGLRFTVPEEQPAAGVTVARRARQHDGLPVRMGEQVVGPMDGRRALGEKAWIGFRILFYGRDPWLGGVPLQEETAAVAADEETVALGDHRVELAIGGAVDPLVFFRIVTEEAHGKRRAAADRAVRCYGHAHDVGAFAGVIEVEAGKFAGCGVFDLKKAFGQVAGLENLAIGKHVVEEALA